MHAERVDDGSLPLQLGGHLFHGVVGIVGNVAGSVRMKSDRVAAGFELEQDVGAVGCALFGNFGGFPRGDGAVAMKELRRRANVADVAIECLLARHETGALEVKGKREVDRLKFAATCVGGARRGATAAERCQGHPLNSHVHPRWEPHRAPLRRHDLAR